MSRTPGECSASFAIHWHEFCLPGVRAETTERVDLRLHIDLLAEHLDFASAVDEQPAKRAAGLETHEHDVRLGLWQAVAQVMTDPPTGAHPAGTDDDKAASAVIQSLALFCIKREAERVEFERVTAGIDHLPCLVIKERAVAPVQLGCPRRHRRVDHDLGFWDGPIAHHLTDLIDESLRASDREAGDQHPALRRVRLLDDLSKLHDRLIDRAVVAVAVRRLQEDHVGVLKKHGIAQQRHVSRPDVP